MIGEKVKVRTCDWWKLIWSLIDWLLAEAEEERMFKKRDFLGYIFQNVCSTPWPTNKVIFWIVFDYTDQTNIHGRKGLRPHIYYWEFSFVAIQCNVYQFKRKPMFCLFLDFCCNDSKWDAGANSLQSQWNAALALLQGKRYKYKYKIQNTNIDTNTITNTNTNTEQEKH